MVIVFSRISHQLTRERIKSIEGLGIKKLQFSDISDDKRGWGDLW